MERIVKEIKKMEYNTDVAEYFREKGYVVISSEALCTHPTFIIEKGDEKKTVVVMETWYFNDSLPEKVYDHLMAGGLIVVPPSIYASNYTLEIYTKDDIEETQNTYYIFWKDR